MGTKQVRLDEDVYAKIEAKKRDGETFSEAIDRLTSDWSLVEWAERYDSDTDELEAAVEEVEETDQEKTEELLEQLGVDE